LAETASNEAEAELASAQSDLKDLLEAEGQFKAMKL
jgi:hypothetical protein